MSYKRDDHQRYEELINDQAILIHAFLSDSYKTLNVENKIELLENLVRSLCDHIGLLYLENIRFEMDSITKYKEGIDDCIEVANDYGYLDLSERLKELKNEGE